MHRQHTGTDPAVIISSMTYSHQVTMPIVYAVLLCIVQRCPQWSIHHCGVGSVAVSLCHMCCM